MPRLTTRQMRKMQLTTSFKHRFRNATAAHRPKTFATKEAAESYAKDTLKVKDYTIVPAKKNKRFKVVAN